MVLVPVKVSRSRLDMPHRQHGDQGTPCTLLFLLKQPLLHLRAVDHRLLSSSPYLEDRPLPPFFNNRVHSPSVEDFIRQQPDSLYQHLRPRLLQDVAEQSETAQILVLEAGKRVHRTMIALSGALIEALNMALPMVDGSERPVGGLHLSPSSPLQARCEQNFRYPHSRQRPSVQGGRREEGPGGQPAIHCLPLRPAAGRTERRQAPVPSPSWK